MRPVHDIYYLFKIHTACYVLLDSFLCINFHSNIYIGLILEVRTFLLLFQLEKIGVLGKSKKDKTKWVHNQRPQSDDFTDQVQNDSENNLDFFTEEQINSQFEMMLVSLTLYKVRPL